MRLVYLDSALSDLDVIERYLENIADLATGIAFTNRLRAECRRLAELGGLLGTDRGNLRTGFRSTYTGNTVEIVDILHGSRDIGTFYDVP